MTDKELQKVLNAIKYVPSESERDEVTQIILRAASESITLERLKLLMAKERKTDSNKNGANGFITFTKKEINQMPDYLKKLFTVNEHIVPYRFINGVYQARFRRDGYNIEVASKNFDIMKQKFSEKLIAAEKQRQNENYPLFKDFVEEWLKVKRQTLKETTYKSYFNLVTNILIPRFGHLHLNEITRKEVQDFLFGYTDQGKNRSAQKLKLLLSAIFDIAAEDYDVKSPMGKIVLPHYEVKKGNAFTKAEEKKIVDYCCENSNQAKNSALLVLLYTGMRVGELESMEYDGTYITCISEKTRKGYAEVKRKIPVSPMMKKVLPLIDFEKTRAVSQYMVRDALKRIFPDRHVHELRYTFITRAKETGILPEVVMKWAGHEYDAACKSSKVDRGYTDFSEEFLLKEINKFDYEL